MSAATDTVLEVESGYVMAIDPGFTGAIALYDSKRHSLMVEDLPTRESRSRKTELDTAKLAGIFGEYLPWCDVAVIEQVGTMPRQGIGSAGRFMYGAGILRGMVAMEGTPLVMVPPAKWKIGAGVKATHDMNRADRKNASRDRAVQVFPQHAALFARVKDDGRAEAALLAWWYAHAGSKTMKAAA